jgi:hypothetical protein
VPNRELLAVEIDMALRELWEELLPTDLGEGLGLAPEGVWEPGDPAWDPERARAQLGTFLRWAYALGYKDRVVEEARGHKPALGKQAGYGLDV